MALAPGEHPRRRRPDHDVIPAVIRRILVDPPYIHAPVPRHTPNTTASASAAAAAANRGGRWDPQRVGGLLYGGEPDELPHVIVDVVPRTPRVGAVALREGRDDHAPVPGPVRAARHGLHVEVLARPRALSGAFMYRMNLFGELAFVVICSEFRD
ncbi:hypothetical protein QJS10_CPB17g02606 [Acorus calamus]|uniref:Uncharacterized protein n=1 Tax=Acorus calamus TaxID=4465 RepID=A0AAV9CRZ0_ACOCL|nr:hypothetical protein QJS10_CPB17g02606 [Acorus calamus]